MIAPPWANYRCVRAAQAAVVVVSAAMTAGCGAWIGGGVQQTKAEGSAGETPVAARTVDESPRRTRADSTRRGRTGPEDRARGLWIADQCAAERQIWLTERACRTPNSLATSCKLGEGKDCRRLGLCFARGWGVPVDEQRSNVLFAHACRLADGHACMLAGQAKRGCALGSVAACARHGVDLLAAANDAPGRRAALATLEKACRAGAGAACRHVGLATWRAVEHKLSTDGDGGRELAQKAVTHLHRACKLCDASGCLDAARIVRGACHVWGVACRLGNADDLQSRACELGKQLACR